MFCACEPPRPSFFPRSWVRVLYARIHLYCARTFICLCRDLPIPLAGCSESCMSPLQVWAWSVCLSVHQPRSCVLCIPLSFISAQCVVASNIFCVASNSKSSLVCCFKCTSGRLICFASPSSYIEHFAKLLLLHLNCRSCFCLLTSILHTTFPHFQRMSDTSPAKAGAPFHFDLHRNIALTTCLCALFHQKYSTPSLPLLTAHYCHDT